MANDREVLRLIWEGQLPVCFQADPEETSAVRNAENFYVMISRLSYLPLVTEKVPLIHFIYKPQGSDFDFFLRISSQR